MTPTEKLRDNPFEVLGVPLDVDGRAVRQAFAKKLREARTSGDQEAVRKVQAAFEAIRDDMPRKQARQFLENETRLSPLLQEADAALETGDLERARRLLREATEVIPDFISVLWQLARVEQVLENVNG